MKATRPSFEVLETHDAPARKFVHPRRIPDPMLHQVRSEQQYKMFLTKKSESRNEPTFILPNLIIGDHVDLEKEEIHRFPIISGRSSKNVSLVDMNNTMWLVLVLFLNNLLIEA